MNNQIMDLTILGVKGAVLFGVWAITLLVATYSTYAERVLAAFFQDRVGPDRAGPFGLLQPLADAGKMFFKEEFMPATANKVLYLLGPAMAMAISLMTSVVIPFGDTLEVDGRFIPMQGMSVNIGILYIFGLVSLGVYGIMIGGWASNNKFSLLGAIRAASQNISYELAMGMSIIAVLMMSGSLDLGVIVAQQHGANWNILYQPFGFIIFLVCSFAETNRTPFDLPECETELVGGYHTEYSGMKMGLYMFAEYVNMFVASAVMSAMYFGGYNFPFMDSLPVSHNVLTLIGTGVFFLKIFAFIFFFMWIRWTLPRFRYDQLMGLGWKSLIPLSMLNVVLTGGAILLKDYFMNR